MPNPLTAAQVIDYVRTLEQDYSTYAKEEKDRLALYGLYKEPTLPPDLRRGEQVNMLSPDLIDAQATIRSDLLPMQTEITVIPQARDEKGMIPEKDKNRADNLEHSLAISLGNLDHDRRLSRDVIFRQLIDRLAIIAMDCKEPSPPYTGGMTAQEYARAEQEYMCERFMWDAYDVDPTSCAMMVSQGIPTVLGRRFRQTIMETQRAYTQLRTPDGMNGALKMDKGKWTWVPMSDDYRVDTSHRFGGIGPLGGKTIADHDMLVLYDQDFTYHVALDATGSNGQLVWWRPNYLGRVGAFLVPGNETPLREPENRWEPYLYPLMVVTSELNTLRTIRATASRNRATQQAYAPYDPETVRQLKAAGIEVPTHVTWKATGEVPYVATKQIVEREVFVDPDLDKNIADLKEDRDRYRPQSVAALADPSVLKESTAAAILNAGETAMRKLGPLVTNYDSAKRQMLEAICHSIKHVYGKGEYGKMLFLATGEEVVGGKKVPKNKAFTLDADALDFPYKIRVSTKMQSLGLIAAAYEYVRTAYERGDATHEEVLTARNISDTQQFYFTKAREEAIAQGGVWVMEQVKAAVADEIAMDLGIMIPLGQPVPEGGAGGGSAPPVDATRGSQTNAPNVPGPPSAPEMQGPGGATP